MQVLSGSGLGFNLGLVEERARGKANSSRGTRRHVGKPAWRAAVQGGAGGRGSPAGGVLGVDVVYGPRYPAQKKGGADVMLTEY